VSWTLTNRFAGLDAKLKGGSLGSSKSERPTIADGDTQTMTVVVPAGAERLDVAIGNVSDAGADLDLYVYNAAGQRVAYSASAGSDESVSLAKPAAGTYTIMIDAYDVPAGTTAYDYRDVYYSAALGSVKVDEAKVYPLAPNGTAQISADVVANEPAPAGREFFGEVQVLNERGTVAGLGSVEIGKVLP